MTSKTHSRWSQADDESDDYEARRQQDKAEKRRLREDKAKKLQDKSHRQAQVHEATQSAAQSVPEITSATGVTATTLPQTSYSRCSSIQEYDILNAIEEGSYGKVSRARTKATGEIVALKKLKLSPADGGFPVTGLREIQTLRACSNANVVNLIDVAVGSSLQDVYLVMEFVEHDLKTLLEEMPEPFLPSESKTIMLQLCSATNFLHSNWILHRDLKTSNLLMNNRGELKLADFGMARYTGNPTPNLTQLVVTLWYRPPELLLGAEDYGFEIDVWSIGCIFAELLTRQPAFQGTNEVTQLSEIFKLVGTPTRDLWPGFRSLPNAEALHPFLVDAKPTKSSINASQFPYLTAAGLRLLSSLLSLNPNDRPTLSKVLSHSYFKEDPRPKPTQLFPSFPSKAGQEKRRRRSTPQAPDRGHAPKIDAREFASIFTRSSESIQGAGFALRMG